VTFPRRGFKGGEFPSPHNKPWLHIMATTNTDSTSLTSRLSCVGEHLKNELLIVSGYLTIMPITLQPPMVQSVHYEFMENQNGNIVTVGKELRRMCRVHAHAGVGGSCEEQPEHPNLIHSRKQLVIKPWVICGGVKESMRCEMIFNDVQYISTCILQTPCTTIAITGAQPIYQRMR